MLASRRRSRTAINVWPGYVDALSALLMLVIFVLMIFTLAQVFLGEILSDRDQELEALNARLVEISALLGLEQTRNRELDAKVKQISEQYSRSLELRFELAGQVEDLTRVTESDKEQIRSQLTMLASLQQDIAALRELRAELEQRVGQLAGNLEAREGEIGVLRDRTKRLQARLADEEERTLLAQETLEQARVRIDELVAAVAAGRSALSDEKKMTSAAEAQVALLNQQIMALREQLALIGQALRVAEQKNAAQEVELGNLGKRLNTLLAQRVNELEKYRSEFFGRLREVLGENPDIRIVGDRFVFQSELLFASGSADLGMNGREQLGKLATTLKQIAATIPPDINWILQIEGHTDKRAIQTERFPSNWELSTARAVSVVRFLAEQGIPYPRLAATGFAEFHPVDSADTPEALQRNRRIEIKLTDR